MLADFNDWKQCVNERIELLSGDVDVFHSALTTTTRVGPAEDWAMATAKWHLRRSLQKTCKIQTGYRGEIEQKMMSKIFEAYNDSAYFWKGSGKLCVLDLDVGADLCEGMAVGEIDKEKTNGFIA